MKHAALLLPLLAAACTDPPAPSLHVPTAQEEACAADADKDPALQEARAISAGQPNWEFQHETQMRQLRQDAITRCLRSRGLAPRGGVERPR